MVCKTKSQAKAFYYASQSVELFGELVIGVSYYCMILSKQNHPFILPRYQALFRSHPFRWRFEEIYYPFFSLGERYLIPLYSSQKSPIVFK